MWFNLCRKMYAEMNLLELINAFEVFLQFICKKNFYRLAQIWLDTSSLFVINTTESTSCCASEIWKVAVQKETVNSTRQAAQLQHQNKVKCLLFFQTSMQALFWRLLKFSLVILYFFRQGIVTIFSW